MGFPRDLEPMVEIEKKPPFLVWGAYDSLGISTIQLNYYIPGSVVTHLFLPQLCLVTWKRRRFQSACVRLIAFSFFFLFQKHHGGQCSASKPSKPPSYLSLALSIRGEAAMPIVLVSGHRNPLLCSWEKDCCISIRRHPRLTVLTYYSYRILIL